MKDMAGNEIHIGDKVWFTINDSLNFYGGKVVSLDEDFGKVVIKDKANNTYERIIWSILKYCQDTTTQESNNQIPKKICISLWNSKDDSIVQTFDLDEFDVDELRIKL